MDSKIAKIKGALPSPKVFGWQFSTVLVSINNIIVGYAKRILKFE